MFVNYGLPGMLRWKQEAEISYFHGECLFGVEHFLSLIFFGF